MNVTASLREIVDHVHLVSDETSAFLNKSTGEMCVLSIAEFRVAEEGSNLQGYAAWQQELIRKARQVLDSEFYLELPTKFDLHEYRMMEAFCQRVNSPALRERLLREIRGGGAFSRFKRSINALGMEQDWYCYRDKEYETIAVEWLEANGIAYHREMDDEARRT